MVSRKFNQTGRQRIPAEGIISKLEGEPNEPPTLTLSKLDLSKLALPDGALVYLEAYRPTTSSWRRENCGTVKSVSSKNGAVFARVLDDFVGAEGITVRLKVVDPDDHHLLAEADKITPSVAEGEEGPPLEDELIKYRKADLGEKIWDVEWTPTGPQVRVNYLLPDAETFVTSSPLVQGCVLPAVLNEISARIFAMPGIVEEEPWAADWVKFLNNFSQRDLLEDPIIEEDEEEERDRIRDAIVREFCLRHKFMSEAKSEMLSESDD